MLPTEKRIQTKGQLKDWIECETAKYGQGGRGGYSLFPILQEQRLRNHCILLRHSEFHLNNGHKIRYCIFHFLLRRMQLKYSMQIPENVFAKGLHIVHLAPVIVNAGASCGENIQLFPYTGIVASRKATRDDPDAPTLGNGCALSIGAVVTGKIELADNIVVGANAVVNKSFDEPDIAIAGVPAQKINNNGRSVWINKIAKD